MQVPSIWSVAMNTFDRTERETVSGENTHPEKTIDAGIQEEPETITLITSH